MRLSLILMVSSVSLGAYADVIRLADGQVISGKIQSCQGGEIVVAPLAAEPVLVKVAEVASGEGSDIEHCLGGPKPTARAGQRRWYGGQVLLAELGSVALLPIAGWTNNGSLALVGLGGVLLSPAIVHGVHGNWGRAAGSVALHIGLGLAGTFLGAEVGSGPDDEEGLRAAGGAAIGLLVSQVVATTIDAASLAYEEPPPGYSLGVLFREPADRHHGGGAPTGLSLSVRF